MHWVGLAVIVVVAIIAIPALRGVAAIVLIGLVVAVVWLFQESKTNGVELQQKLAVARTLISPTQLAFSNVTLGSEYGSSYKLKGTVQNNATVDLIFVALHVVLQNCSASADCITVGEQKVTIDSVVPPNQARGFEKSLYFQNLPVIAKMQWHYRVDEVLGNPNQKSAMK